MKLKEAVDIHIARANVRNAVEVIGYMGIVGVLIEVMEADANNLTPHCANAYAQDIANLRAALVASPESIASHTATMLEAESYLEEYKVTAKNITSPAPRAGEGGEI